MDWDDGAIVTAAEVNEVVRRRAAATRQSLEVFRRPQEGNPAAPRVEQWEWLPAPELGVPELGQLAGKGPPGPAGVRSMRRLAAGAMAAAERHGPTRPAAQVARRALSELRAARRAR